MTRTAISPRLAMRTLRTLNAPSGNPPAQSKRPVRRYRCQQCHSQSVSNTRLMIMGLISYLQPVHGYDIRKELASWNVESWADVQPGSIYHALRRLTDEGLLEAVDTEQLGGRPA